MPPGIKHVKWPPSDFTPWTLTIETTLDDNVSKVDEVSPSKQTNLRIYFKNSTRNSHYK
jgi:hypothetical protein